MNNNRFLFLGTTSIPLGGAISKIDINIVNGNRAGPIVHTCSSALDVYKDRYFPQIFQTEPGPTPNYEFLKAEFVKDLQDRIAEWRLDPAGFGLV